MPIKRVPIVTVADPEHRAMMLEGEITDAAPNGKVYIDPDSGTIVDGRKGGTLANISPRMLELPRTTWY
jgi:hypothetical protein